MGGECATTPKEFEAKYAEKKNHGLEHEKNGRGEKREKREDHEKREDLEHKVGEIWNTKIAKEVKAKPRRVMR